MRFPWKGRSFRRPKGPACGCAVQCLSGGAKREFDRNLISAYLLLIWCGTYQALRRKEVAKLLAPEKQINLRLEITLNIALRESLAAGDFIQSIHGRIFVQYDQDESEQTAGYVNASL